MSIIPTDRESIYSDLKYLTKLERNAIVRPDNPPFGISGFVFDIVSEDGAELTSDITDHYIEDNSSIVDNIALKPEIVTVRASVGEVVQTIAQVEFLSKKQSPLPINDEFSPEFSDQQVKELVQKSVDEQEKFIEVSDLNSLKGYYDTKTNLRGNQNIAFDYFYQLWKGRQLCTVETPWGTFVGMAIQSIKATQGEDSKYISEFSVTFKKVRFASALTVKIGQLEGRAVEQSATEKEGKTIGKKDVPRSGYVANALYLDN